MPPVIEAKDISKQYTISRRRSTSIKEKVIHELFSSEPKEKLWALKDVSFSIERGMTLGIIGANGSGKSTLLKIISGIIPPSSGEIDVRGRVASLLELGVGFHPELTGLENIYMNGSVLGLQRKRIDELREEIIAFSELEQFIHMPVKHYSSGMLVRLGFSVAIHVDPDVLVLDEVMAVGDTGFQKRSSRKIHEFKENGKTIILVTHNLDQAEQISDRVLWLDSGRSRVFGTINQAITGYIREFYDHKLKDPPMPFDLEFGTLCRSSRLGSGEILITRVVLTDGGGNEIRTAKTGKILRIEVHYTAPREGMDLEAVMGIGQLNGLSVTRVDSTGSSEILKNAPRNGVVAAEFSPLIMKEGSYHLSVALNPPGKPYEPYDMHLRFYEFRIAAGEGDITGGVVNHPVRFELREDPRS